MLEKKIIEPILEKSMAKKTLKKPVLVITITDGVVIDPNQPDATVRCSCCAER